MLALRQHPEAFSGAWRWAFISIAWSGKGKGVDVSRDWDDPRSGTLVGGRYRLTYLSKANDGKGAWGVLDEAMGIGYVRGSHAAYEDAHAAADRMLGRRPTLAL